MAADRVSVVVLLAAALLFFAGAVRGSELRPRLLGAPQTIDDPENDEGLERALQFAMTAYNRASNDMYSSRVVRIISAQKQVSDPGGGTPCWGAGNEAGRIPLEKGQTASLRASSSCRFFPRRRGLKAFFYILASLSLSDLESCAVWKEPVASLRCS